MKNYKTRLEGTDREVCTYCQCEILPGKTVYLKCFPHQESPYVFDREECSRLQFPHIGDLELEERMLSDK